MTAQQKIELKRSEIRQRLGAIAEFEGEALTEAVASERDGLMTELRSSESQLQAAIAVRGHGDAGGVGSRAARRWRRGRISRPG